MPPYSTLDIISQKILFVKRFKTFLKNFSKTLEKQICLCYNVKVRKYECKVCIMQRYFVFDEYILTLRLTSELVDLRVGYAKRNQ